LIHGGTTGVQGFFDVSGSAKDLAGVGLVIGVGWIGLYRKSDALSGGRGLAATMGDHGQQMAGAAVIGLAFPEPLADLLGTGEVAGAEERLGLLEEVVHGF
jgi:hypothetical protein